MQLSLKLKKILNDLLAKINNTTKITPNNTTWPKSFCKKAIINTTTKMLKNMVLVITLHQLIQVS